MAKDTEMSDFSVNVEADAWAPHANSGKLRIYDNTGAVPANCGVAISTQVLLAELTMNATAFPAAVAGLLTANAITSGVAGASGTAAFYRLFKSDGTTLLCQGTINTATANMILGTTAITSGTTVAVSSFTHQMPKATAGL